MTDVSSHSATAPARRVPLWVFPLVGVAAAALGLVPWLMSGARLPLQNLSARGAIDPDAPFVLLPFSQYAVTVIFALIVVGAAIAGITARALNARHRRGATALTVVGVALVHLVAITQTTSVVEQDLRDGGESVLYTAGIAGGSVACALVGVAVAVLIARAPRAGAVIGLTIGAIAVQPWLTEAIVPRFGPMPTEMPLALEVLRWFPAVLTGAAIAWAGVTSVGRVAAALGAMALLWTAPALQTAVSAALGSRAMLRDLPGLYEYGVGVFGMALFLPNLVLPQIAVAVGVAAVGLAVRFVIERRRADASDPSAAPPAR